MFLNNVNEYLFIFNNIIASPLDQFGDDDDYFIEDFTVVDILYNIFFVQEFLNFSAFDEFTDINNCISALLSNVGSFLFDDEDSDNSEWEESDSTISNIQASIFTSNISGMIIGTETITSDASLTFFLSFSIIILVIIIGVAFHNIRFFSVLIPTGTPLIMAPFIILIEFISFMARAISLGMRLFANMFAGHSLVKILMSFAWLFLNSTISLLNITAILVLVAIFFLEIGIAYLQAYVFGVLTCMYLEEAISLGH